MFKKETFYDLCNVMEAHVKAGKLNGMSESKAWQYAMECMRADIETFNKKWLDSKVNESYNKTVKKSKDLYPGYPY